MRLEYHCNTCSKVAVVQSEISAGKSILSLLSCGHIELKEKLILKDSDNLESYKAVDGSGKEAYEFQKEGIKFAEINNLNCLIADAMGLGKTIQAQVIFKRNIEKMAPALVLTRSSIIYQWCREFNTWVDGKPFSVMPVVSRAQLLPGMQFYVMSMDLLSKNGILEAVKNLGIKGIVIDECQFFKDPQAERSKALIKLIQEGNIKYKIALSGTPIKNKASEYFTILNILAPQHFRSLTQFKRQWLIPNEKGVYTKLNPYMFDKFHALISKWVLRREKKDVLLNLPPLTRDYQLIEIEDEIIKKSYNHQLTLFDNFLQNNARITQFDILGWLAKLRAITGQAKCQNAVEWAEEFLESSDDSLAIGIHHHSVRDTLHYVFEQKGYSPLKLSGEDNSYAKERIVRSFNNGENKLLIINMLAGGIGLNLQKNCHNFLVLEREWNPADEWQFEGRFSRDGQKYPTMGTYLIARGTIDEWFHKMIYGKVKVHVETIEGKRFTDDMEGLRELAEKTVRNKL